MLRPLFLFVFLVVAPAVFAKGYSPALTARAGGYDVKFSPSGQPIAVPVTAGISGAAAAQVASSFVFKWPNGVDAAGAAVSIFTGAKTAGAFGAASAALGIASLYAIPVIKNWMDTAALQPMNGGGLGSMPLGADNFDYSWDGGYSWFSTPMGACQALADSQNNPSAGVWGKRVPINWVYDGSGSGGACFGNLIYQNYSNTDSDRYNINLGGTNRRAKQLPVDPVPIAMDAALSRLALASPTAAAVQALVDLNFPPEPELPVMSGPVSQFKGNVVSLGLDGTVQEIEERYIASFQPGLIQIGVEKKQTVTTPEKKSTVITTNPDGSTSAAVITTPKTSSTLTTTGAGENAALTCGLPGTPACKMDEAGTPAAVPENQFKPLADKNKADADAARSTIAGTADKPFFSGWSSLFFLPPVVACTPFELPRSMGSIDPCPVADGMRAVMAWIWSAGGLFLCLGMIKKVV